MNIARRRWQTFKNNKRARALFEDLLRTFSKKAAGKISLSIDINPSST